VAQNKLSHMGLPSESVIQRKWFIYCVKIPTKYVCVRGGPNQPLHRDPQWSIVLGLLQNIV
jgi:hypothetical protein